jgi:hypothetical protein
MKYLKERHSEHWAARSGMRQLKLFTERPLDKLSGNLLALDWKQGCQLATVY